MTSATFLELESDLHAALERHLLPPLPESEEAGFLFVRTAPATAGSATLVAVDHEFVSPEGFDLRSLHAIELSDATRARVIKRAHDLGASIVEFHSHPFPYQAEFSWSDRAGLRELVPHVRWRLKGRPYVAVVVAPRSFDALIWATDSPVPETLAGIRVGERCLRPTGLSRRQWGHADD